MSKLGALAYFAASDPVSVINSVLGDFKKWGIAIYLAVVFVVVIFQAIQHQQGSEEEQMKARKNIKRSLIWSAGIFIALWIASYLYTKFAVLNT